MKSTLSLLLEQGEQAAEASHFEAAVMQFSKALEIEPDNLDAMRGLRHALGMLGRLEECIGAARRLINLGDDDIETYEELIWALQSSEADTEARTACDLFLSMGIASDYIWLQSGDMHYRKLEWQEAADAYAQVAAGTSEHRKAAVRYCSCLYALQRYDEAQTALHSILAETPHSPHANHLMSLIHTVHGDISKAILTAEIACKGNPENAEFAEHLATCFLRLKRYRESIGLFERAIELDPSCIEAKIKLAICHFGLNEIARYKEIFAQLVEHDIDQVRAAGSEVARQGGYGDRYEQMSMHFSSLQASLKTPID